MRFVPTLVDARGISVDSARVYLLLGGPRLARARIWYTDSRGLKFERQPQMLKGLRRIKGDLPKRVRRGITPKALCRAMGMLLDPNNPANANIRVALATALQGLLRSKEFIDDDPKTMLTRLDLANLTRVRSLRCASCCIHAKRCTTCQARHVPWSSEQESPTPSPAISAAGAVTFIVYTCMLVSNNESTERRNMDRRPFQSWKATSTKPTAIDSLLIYIDSS